MAVILLADDDDAVRDLVAEVLKADGHEVIEVKDGRDALARLGLEGAPSAAPLRPDAIVMDVMMPNVDGFTAHNRLRENAATKRIPVIILTSKGQMREPFSSASSFTTFMEKPFKAAELRGAVAKALGGHAA